jgi:DNA-binding transcriptional ArsR family regulator
VLVHQDARLTSSRRGMCHAVEQSPISMDEHISAEMLRAVAHPVRLAALDVLEQRERTADELATALDVPAEALAEHLAELAAAGLITGDLGDGRLRPLVRGWAELAARLRWLQSGAR